MRQLSLVWPQPQQKPAVLRVVDSIEEEEPEPLLQEPTVLHTRFPILQQHERQRFAVVWPPPLTTGKISQHGPGDDIFAEELFALDPFPATEEAHAFKPSTRNDCAQGPRPCPWVSCRYNLYLDVREDGKLKLNFPDKEPDEVSASCALDLAEDGPRTLDSIAALMGMSKERARQLEAAAFEKLYERLPRPGVETEEDDWI